MRELPSGSEVARLRAPMPIKGVDATVRGLEAQYGKGLMLAGEDDNEGVTWFVIRTPGEAP